MMDTLVWKRRIGKLYPVKNNVSRKIIMLYHAVGSGPQALEHQLFFKQMAWLREHCKVVSLTNLLQIPVVGDGIQVAISFDDGYACLYREVAPILSHFNMPAIVYINTGWIGDSETSRKSSDPNAGHYFGESFLIWNEVLELAQQGWEIGSHGVDHLDLTKQSHDCVAAQLTRSKQMIESYLQHPCLHFAYTWGKHTKKLREMVAQSYYQYAVAGHHTVVSKKENSYALPRMNVEQRYSMEDFINIVQGNWDYLNVIHHWRGKLA